MKHQIIAAITQARKDRRRVYVVGNGGSYANAVHIVNDLVACGVRAQTIDPATLTAIGNDFGYENVFSRWLAVQVEAGDILIALSGSGKSPNILRAIEIAENLGVKTFLVTDYLRSMNMQESEEEQVRLGHDIWRELKCAQ